MDKHEWTDPETGHQYGVTADGLLWSGAFHGERICVGSALQFARQILRMAERERDLEERLALRERVEPVLRQDIRREAEALVATLEAEIEGRVAIRQMDMEKIAAAAERERKLRETLDLLAAEALALLDCYAASLPAVVATTNINCLRRAAEAARALLKEE